MMVDTARDRGQELSSKEAWSTGVVALLILLLLFLAPLLYDLTQAVGG